MPRLRDRSDAGRRLAEVLAASTLPNPVVLGLPRGGVVVGAAVADRLGAPLDVVLVRKLGVPWQPELAMGAIAEGGIRVVHEAVRRAGGIDDAELARVEAEETAALATRARRYRGTRPPVPLSGRTAVVVDDGIATGSTMRVACLSARARDAALVVAAAPVAPFQAVADLRGVTDAVVCLVTPNHLLAIGEWYDDFTQSNDAEVLALLASRGAGPHARGR